MADILVRESQLKHWSRISIKGRLIKGKFDPTEATAGGKEGEWEKANK